MGLYALVFGKNPNAPELLKVLNLTEEDFGRYQDAFVTDGEIAVYTKIGGKHKKQYEHIYQNLERHPLYKRCVDDTYFKSYATFYFKIPKEHRERLRKFNYGKWNPDERWQRAHKSGDVHAVLNHLEDIRNKP